MKTILITGAAGFIGSTLCDALLARGDKVIGVDNFNEYYSPAIKRFNLDAALVNPNFTLIQEDIRNRMIIMKIVTDAQPDVVVHLAAQAGVRPSLEDPMLYNDVNVGGTQNILDACAESDISNVVMASSSSVYGTIPEVPFHEAMDVSQMISPYAATKRMNELMAHVYHHIYGLNITMLRFFTAYGPRQRPDMAISKFARLMKEGKSIPMYGDGTTYRDYTYISDIVGGVIKAIDTPLGYEIINLGEGETVSLSTLLSLIGQALQVNPIVETLPMQPGDVKETYADISKAKTLLGYDPQTSITEGLRLYAQWLNTSHAYTQEFSDFPIRKIHSL